MLGPGIYKYSLLTNSWSQGLPMNEPRWLLGSASFKNIAIFAGGVDRNGKIMDAVESYDSETGTWKTLPSMIKPRKLSSGVFMDGKFYVIGGISSNDSNPLTCGEEYDLDTQKWTEIPNMSPGGGGPRMAPPLLAVASNELYAADCAAMELKMYSKKNKE
ncbi:putative kelch-type beta propeller [Helianthus annuus]|nr:putative kelch-type beta propeller [Helianthus annuus]